VTIALSLRFPPDQEPTWSGGFLILKKSNGKDFFPLEPTILTFARMPRCPAGRAVCDAVQTYASWTSEQAINHINSLELIEGPICAKIICRKSTGVSLFKCFGFSLPCVT
jgi:hypothetical protein